MNTVILAVLGIAAFVAAVHTIWTKGLVPLGKTISAIHKTYESVLDQDTRLRVVEKRTEELVNNSGSSLKDSVNRSEEAIKRVESAQVSQTQAFNAHLAWAQNELLSVWQNLAARDSVDVTVKAGD